MSTTLASTGLGVAVGWNYQNVLNIGNSQQSNQFKFSPTQFANGTAAGQCDRLYASQQSIAASGTFSITLTNFVDFFGNTVSMLRFKLLYVQLVYASTGASSIAFGNATNPVVNWISSGAATIQVRNGGLLYLVSPNDATGYPITASTADTFKITNNDGSNAATVNMCVMGCSA